MPAAVQESRRNESYVIRDLAGGPVEGFVGTLAVALRCIKPQQSFMAEVAYNGPFYGRSAMHSRGCERVTRPVVAN